ncbi:hypothetical protein [Burkholderia seminalis]|uniref:hypothetical protein n=1 Tax=Burkholderia seminalis TaxID=488731 RepID=UPI00264BF677|nr:hypothetical protein [Burkholderia seminalis]MDN7587266.1 hypothetical protein [Burkholderia seminalis]
MAQNQSDAFRASIFQGAIAGVISAVLSILGTFLVTYLLIEKPKMAIQAEAEQVKLIPNISIECRSFVKDQWTWEILCDTKNKGSYPAIVKIESVRLVKSDEYPLRQFYVAGNGFTVVYQDNQDSYQSLPNGEGGELVAYVVLDKKIFPSGSGSVRLSSVVQMSYTTLPEIVDIVTSAYSRTIDGDPATISRTGNRVMVYLSTWTPPAPTPIMTPASPVAASAAVVPAIQAGSVPVDPQDGNGN